MNIFSYKTRPVAVSVYNKVSLSKVSIDKSPSKLLKKFLKLSACSKMKRTPLHVFFKDIFWNNPANIYFFKVNSRNTIKGGPS